MSKAQGADPEQRLADARERADMARLRFVNSVKSAQRRLSFGRLKDDALVAAADQVAEVREDLRQAVRRHPFMTASAAAGLVAVMFWKPARVAALYGMRGAQILWFNRRLWRQSDE